MEWENKHRAQSNDLRANDTPGEDDSLFRSLNKTKKLKKVVRCQNGSVEPRMKLVCFFIFLFLTPEVNLLRHLMSLCYRATNCHKVRVYKGTPNADDQLIKCNQYGSNVR